PVTCNADRARNAAPGWGRRKAWIVATTVVLIVAAVAGWQLDSLRPEKCYRRGRLALAAGDIRTATRESRRLIAIPGFEAQGWLLSGLCRIHEGRHADALVELQRAAWDQPTDVDALTAAAACYYALGQYVDAVKLARAALAK